MEANWWGIHTLSLSLAPHHPHGDRDGEHSGGDPVRDDMVFSVPLKFGKPLRVVQKIRFPRFGSTGSKCVS